MSAPLFNDSVWEVHKFGGSSLADAEGYRRLAQVVCTRREVRPVVVVSASGDTTDRLFDLIRSEDPAQREWDAATLKRRRLNLIQELLPLQLAQVETVKLERDFEEIHRLLQTERIDEVIQAQIVGYGELWSASLAAAFLNHVAGSATALDARGFIFLDTAGEVDQVRSRTALIEVVSELEARVPVVTGYLATSAEGCPSNLGRNGSDHTAALVAAYLEARSCTLWSDVDGILSGDPDVVPDAILHPRFSIEDLSLLADLDVGVVHRNTLNPIRESGVPLYLRNSFKPHREGTRISVYRETEALVLTGLKHVALLEVRTGDAALTPRFSQALSSRFADVGVRIYLQKRYEGGFDWVLGVRDSSGKAVPLEQLVSGLDYLKEGFPQVRLQVREGLSLVALVGDAPLEAGDEVLINNVRQDQLLLAGREPSRAWALLSCADPNPVVCKVHRALFGSRRRLQVCLLGPGLVGSTLLEQLKTQTLELAYDSGLDLAVTGLANSRLMLIDENGINPEHWQQRLEEEGVPLDLEQLVRAQQSLPGRHKVIIDTTASEDIAACHPRWLQLGFDVVTANKKGAAGPWSRFAGIRRGQAEHRSLYLHEATVGAGLPILNTIEKLQQTGDGVRDVRGVLSGTLSWLFQAFDGSRPFSEVLREANERGLTEPDPRDDLSGTDVARKLLILARLCGFELDLADVEYENLVPPGLEKVSLTDFWETLPQYDHWFDEKLHEASSRHGTLVYVGELNARGRARAYLKTVFAGDPCARLAPGDNLVLFSTHRYQPRPLWIAGPGAGPDVTAAAVFGDLIRVAERRGLLTLASQEVSEAPASFHSLFAAVP